MMKLKTLPKFINHLPKFTNHHTTHHTKESEQRKFTFNPSKGLRNLKIGHKMILAFGGNILVLLLLGIFILTGQTTQRVLVAVILIVINIALAVFDGILLTRSIGGRIRQMVLSAEKLAEGDINVEIEAGVGDEIGVFLNSFAKIAANMQVQASIMQRIADGDLTVDVPVNSEKDLIGNTLKKLAEQNNQLMLSIRESANQVASGASQVSDSSQMLSSGATEQASSVDELTVTIEQIEAQTVQNAEYANHANELTVAAKERAAAGNEKIKEMVGSMAEINESSANISKIIKVIDDIAFQTNILALNAAVEAARAGQQGKGFAVVAEEVRNLAAKSAEAAQETTELIEGSIKKVKSGTKVAKETASEFGKIVESVTEVSDLIGRIAVASNEQASGIAQVNRAITQVSNVIQTNSATSEESAAASEELSSQAENLKEMIRTFQLKTKKREKVNLSELSPEALQELKEYARKKKAQQGSEAAVLKQARNEKPIKLEELTVSKY